MATTSILPTYQRFLNGAPVPSSTRRSFRAREKHLILLVFLTFGVVCFGGFFFLPEFAGSGTVNSVFKVYKHMQKAGPDLLIPAPPHGDGINEITNKIGLVRHDFIKHPDPHQIEDKAKLLAKIEQDLEMDKKHQKVLERPDLNLNNLMSISSSMKTEVQQKSIDVGKLETVETIVTVPPADTSRYPIISGGEDQDPVARKRRNKVKEVSKK